MDPVCMADRKSIDRTRLRRRVYKDHYIHRQARRYEPRDVIVRTKVRRWERYVWKESRLQARRLTYLRRPYTRNVRLDRSCGRDHIANLVDVQGYIERIAVDDPKVSRSRTSLENVSYPTLSHVLNHTWGLLTSCEDPWHIEDYLQSTINCEIESTSFTVLQFLFKIPRSSH